MAKKKTTTAVAAGKGFRDLFSSATVDAAWHTPRLSTGIIPLDWALSGGWGYGRLAEVFGDYSSGKSHILYLAMIQCQRTGGLAILLETEGAFDPAYFTSLGGDADNLIVIPVDTVEEVFTAIKKIADHQQAAKEASNVVVGWDSIAATATKHLLKKEMEKVDMSKAKGMSTGCQLITNAIKGSNICLISSNQIREKIDMYASGPQTPGGKGYPFHASSRIEMKYNGGHNSSLIKEGDEEIGRNLIVRVEKNKLGPGCRRVHVPFYFGDDRKHPIYDRATTHGVDHDEALFLLYTEGQFRMKPENPEDKPWTGKRAVDVAKNDKGADSKGWYAVHPQFGPLSKEKFRAADWPAMLESCPALRTFPVENL